MSLRGRDHKPLRRQVTIRIGSPPPSTTDRRYKSLFSPLPTKVELSSASSSTSQSFIINSTSNYHKSKTGRSSLPSSSVSSTDKHKSSSSIGRIGSLRLALKRSTKDVGGRVVSSGKKEKKKGGRKRKVSTISSSFESSTDQQTTDNESSITSIPQPSTTSSSSTTLPSTKSISSPNTIETISTPTSNTTQPPATLLSSSTTTNPSQHIVSNRQGRGALSRHITEGLQNQAGTPSVDLRCSVLLIDSDDRPVLCPGIITDVHQGSNAKYTIVVDFDHKETLTLVYPCPERRIFLHKKTWQSSTLLAKHNNQDIRVSFSFLKSPPSTSSTTSRGQVVVKKKSTTKQRKKVETSTSSKAKLVKVATIEELKMKSPRLCSDDSCSLVACCQWELDGELSHECLDHQEKNFGGWKKGKELPIDSMSEEHHDTIVKLCSNNENPDMPYLPPIPNFRQLLKNNIKLSQLEDEASNKLDVTSSNIVGVMKGVALEDLTELQRSLVGYDQTNKPPAGFDRQTCNPVVRRHHDNQRRCEAKLKNRKMKNLIKPDEDVPLCLGSIPYGRNPNSTTKMVVLLNHYQTWQESRSLGPLHTARALLSDGSGRSDTPGLIRGSLGPRNYGLCYWLDLYAIPYPKDGSLRDVVSEVDANFMWECQVEDILRPLLEDDDVVLAFCSRATCLKFAKYVLGNGCEKRGMEKLHKLYEKNPWKFISASDRVFIVNYHASAIYEYFMVLLEHKCEVSNAFFTNALKVITGDPNVPPCTFASDIFSEHSEMFAFMHRVMMKKCKLGGKNSAAKRDESVLSYLLLLEDELSPEQSLAFLETEWSVEHRNYVVGWLKFCKMIELAGQLHREEEIDMEEVSKFATLVGMKVEDLMKNAEACRKGSAEGRAKFTIMAQLSAMLGRGNVADDVVVEMATQCDIKKDDLLKGAKAIKKGRANAHATTVKKGQVSWQNRFDELVKYQEEHGNCKVPRGYKANSQLGKWIANQRYEYKQFIEGKSSFMTEDRIDKLNEVDFEWELGAGYRTDIR